MRVLLFGSSANPPTGKGGHAGLVSWAASHADVDEVWVLPVYRHAFESKRDMPAFEHRLNMARLAFEPLDAEAPVRVLDVERTVAQSMPPSETAGTVDVVRYLQEQHPEARFSLLLGTDTYVDLQAGRWKESEALLQMVGVRVIPRVGAKGNIEGEALVQGVEGLTDISSTSVRRSDDLEFLSKVLQSTVLNYIREHQLYAFSDQ